MTVRPVLPTVLHSCGSRPFILRSLFAAATLIVGVAVADAEPPRHAAGSVQRVQATPAAQGSRGWGQDNCFYVYQSGAWRKADWCRVMRGAAVYDTYTPSTRRWGVRMDESQPGWTGILDLNGGNPNAWFKFSNDGRTILAFNGGQWVNFSAAVAQNRPATGGNPAATLGGTPTFIPGVSAGSILGGGPSTPNHNPLTVDSVAADRARATASPAVRQQLLELQAYLDNSRDTSIKVDTLGTYRRVPGR